jgi:flagellar FliL protein
MAEQAAAKAAKDVKDADAPETEGAEAPPSKKWSGKRIILFIVLPLLVVLGGGGTAGAYFMGFLGGGDKAAEEQAKKDAEPVRTAIFFDIPDLLVNLNTAGKRTSFLKLKVALELGKQEDLKTMEQVLPRVVDNFQVYLRELRAEDLRGSAGLYRLREDLLMRAQTAAQPAEVKDVLFKEMLIQ